MPRFNISGFGDVKSTMEPLPVREFRCQLTNVEERTGKDKGTMYLNWTLTVVDDPEFSGRNLFYMTMLEPKEALFKLKALCEAVGKGWDSNGLDTDAMIGSTVVVKVGHETYKETIRNSVLKVSKA